MTRDDIKTFWALPVDHSAVGLEPMEKGDFCFCTPEDAEPFARLGCDGVHFILLPENERVYCVDPAMGERGSYVLPVGENLRAFLSYLLYCRDANPITQIWWMNKERFRAFREEEAARTWEGMEDFLGKKEKALSAIAAAFGLIPVDPWKPVKSLQASFDPAIIRFSDEYYETLGLEPLDERAWQQKEKTADEFELVAFVLSEQEEKDQDAGVNPPA